MKKPTCCGLTCKAVQRTYGKYGYHYIGENGIKWAAGSVIAFFKCRVCGHLGVPFSGSHKPSEDLGAIRSSGIKSDFEMFGLSYE